MSMARQRSGLASQKSGQRGRRRANGNGRIFLILGAVACCAFALMRFAPDMDPEFLDIPLTSILPRQSAAGAAIVPFDLSVNHLQRIPLAAGARPEQANGAAEDFLPIVAGDLPDLRFRLKGSIGSSPSAMKDISAYQIQAEHAHSSVVLWDSGKVNVKGMPHSIEWGGKPLKVGTIVKWRVLVWDSEGMGPSTSQWTTFGVGPTEWIGKWITHPDDMTKFEKTTHFGGGVTKKECTDWMARRPLPVARAQVKLSKEEQNKEVVSALLVVSGLGSFSTSFDSMPLSSSSVLDPAMMDYTARVSYRGYDVTSHFADKAKKEASHVVGITLGSGWWDGRPLKGGIVKFHLLPRGPLTTVAEMHFTFSDGTTAVKIPSGTSSDWQVAKGFIRDSDLFTGETIDLGLLKDMEGWDSPAGWGSIRKNSGVVWMGPALYASDISRDRYRQLLAEKAGAKEKGSPISFSYAPIGKLIPSEAPPVMPIERIFPESVVDLGGGRWLLDFGKAMSGVLRFEDGLPTPIKPKRAYPRAHSVAKRANEDESFITVVYGESLEMETGDINLVLVAGMGLHDGGPRARTGGDQYDTAEAGGPCYPRDHGMILAQRDVFILPKKSSGSYADARQPLFTSHGFRFAEVCCTEKPPSNAFALAYRTNFDEWGKFDSSNVLLNGAYELTRNALNSNMLGWQTDCPHRERLQYGGDLVADSPAAMHFFDLSAFYSKIIHDWIDTQWDNGGYTETSIWQDLNEYAAIGHGAGETVWAALPPVLTVRHAQHYGDMKLVEGTFDHHAEWLAFLIGNWEAGMHKLFISRFGKTLASYYGSEGGLGDWLSIQSRDVWLTHNAFFMASARAIAYLAQRLGNAGEKAKVGASALNLANDIKGKINDKYMKYDSFEFRRNADWTPGPDLGLFARIVPGDKRCEVLKNWIHMAGSGDFRVWPGDEEILFWRHLNNKDLDEMIRLNRVRKDGKKFETLWTRRHNVPEGILAIRYSLKALSDLGFHNIALSRVNGVGCPSFEYMLSHNATTMWESWWRSEDVYSRNHPMLGAVAEWLASSVAGVSLAPKTVGGEQILFWPRIPTSALVVKYASATQGTKRGDASIAWEFVRLPEDTSSHDSAMVQVHIRVLLPPGSTAILRLPTTKDGKILIKYAETLPDLDTAKSHAADECTRKRLARKGFNYNWEYDRHKKEWNKFYNGKAIGTPCRSYLFDSHLESKWSEEEEPIFTVGPEVEMDLKPGFYDIVIEKWQLQKEIEDKPGYGAYSGDLGHYCSDPETFEWDINDATHII